VAAHDTVLALLRTASQLMELPIAQFEQMLQGDLEVKLSPRGAGGGPVRALADQEAD
jgi:hypothetical protein